MKVVKKYVNDNGAFGWILFGKVQLHQEVAGLISEDICWIVFHDAYMYGPYDYWYQAIWYFLIEHKNDSHLVM